MKHINSILALTLAVVMALVSPLNVLAAGKEEYISEIRIGYGDEGKAALEAEDFIVWTDLNANEGGKGSAVWIGYKITDDSGEAITDVALMNMKGGYSFDDYTKEVEELNRQVSEQLSNFEDSIAEFRDNYNAGNVYATEAYKIMNCYYDDDTLDSAGNPVGVGDIMIDENTSKETLHRIFLEGNTEAVTAIERCLGLGCIEEGEDNLITRLEEAEEPEELDASLINARTNLMNAFENFSSTAEAAKQLYDEASQYEGGIEAFVSRETLSDAEKCVYVTKLSQYELLSNTVFGDTEMTLLDFALLDDEEADENGNILCDAYLEMLAQCMTAGQRGLVANLGIMTILVNAEAGTDSEAAETSYEAYNENINFDETVSVYYEVDRTLFSDTDSVALTSDALREKAASENSDFGKDTGVDRTKAIIFTAVGAAALAAGSVAITLGVKAIYTRLPDRLRDVQEIIEFMDDVEEVQAVGEAVGGTTGTVSVGGVCSLVGGCIAVLAGIVLAIFAIIQWLKKPETQKIVYTQIPRVLVERPAGQSSFITYYAAKLAGAAEDETDSLKLYGDLNGLNEEDEWVALYYTKNTDMGTPITTEMLVQSTGTLKTTHADRYSPVHMFGSSSAANLNQYNTGSGAKSIYVFFRNDGSGSSQTASIFTTGSVVLGLVTFLAGAGISAAVTYILTKKKKTKAA